jgi:tRNA nucleotidyltransferase (CCA-adding enzyme)
MKQLRATSPRWEHFEAGGKIGVRGFGPTREAAFEQAALATMAVVSNPKKVRHKHVVPIFCEAPDDALLLAQWLDAVIAEVDYRNMLFGGFKVHIQGNRLVADAWGERIDREHSKPRVKIDEVSYQDLLVRALPDDGWMAQCVLEM